MSFLPAQAGFLFYNDAKKRPKQCFGLQYLNSPFRACPAKAGGPGGGLILQNSLHIHNSCSHSGGIDIGGTIGSYIGLIFLGAVFTAISICASSFTNNTVVAFIGGAFVCFLLYNGFDAMSKLPIFKAGWDYYIEMLGINFHYRSISRGVVDSRDIIYFLGIMVLFLFITQRNLVKR